MAKVHESSFITTLAAMEAMEREQEAAEARRLSAEYEWRERRFAAETRAAEQRARLAEEDRQRALQREQEQQTARLRAQHLIAVQRACSEADTRYERERLSLLQQHEQSMAQLRAEARVSALKRWLAFSVSLSTVAAVLLLLLLDAASTARAAARASSVRENELSNALLHAEQELLAARRQLAARAQSATPP
jgi:hypothetical protein